MTEKLDVIIEAEKNASSRIDAAKAKADAIIAEATEKADKIKQDSKTETYAAVKEILNGAREKSREIETERAAEAESEAEKIRREASRNDRFGMSSVIIKLIPN